MSNIFLATGVAVVPNPNDNGSVVVFNTGEYDTAALDALFVPGDATYDRVDVAYLRVTDAATGGWELYVNQGPADGNLNRPNPDSDWDADLAEVLVPAGATSWDECTFTDSRTRSTWGQWRGGTIVAELIESTIPSGYIAFETAGQIVMATDSGTGLSGLSVRGAGSIGVFHAFGNSAQPDNSEDSASFFESPTGMTRADRPTIDPTGIADTDLQAVVVMLIKLGLVIDGTP